MRSPSLALLLFACCTTATKTPVSDALFQNLTRYAAFASAAYSSDCTIPPYGTSVVQYFTNSTTGTEATLFRDDSAEEFILAFRGTSSVDDFEEDFDQTLVTCDAPGIGCATSSINCTCSEGYLEGYNSVEPAVTSSLTSNLDTNPSYGLTITGHSLGGGVVSIASLSLRGLGYDFDVYSYGQPRTGDPVYADYVDSTFGGQGGSFYRATHTYDGVPQIPSQSDGYQHHLTEYWQSEDPPAANTTYQCVGQEPPDCNLSELGIGLGNGGIGINPAHLVYFGISIGDPLDEDYACQGTIT